MNPFEILDTFYMTHLSLYIWIQRFEMEIVIGESV